MESSFGVQFPQWLPREYLDALSPSSVEYEADMVLLGRTAVLRENAEFSDPDYWVEGQEGASWWIFGETGQGDHWLLHTDNQVYFFDHDRGLRSSVAFIPFVESFPQWIKAAEALAVLSGEAEVTPAVLGAVRLTLDHISPGLASRYPFDLAADGS